MTHEYYDAVAKLRELVSAEIRKATVLDDAALQHIAEACASSFDECYEADKALRMLADAPPQVRAMAYADVPPEHYPNFDEMVCGYAYLVLEREAYEIIDEIVEQPMPDEAG